MEQGAQRVQIVYARQRAAPLPPVDGLRVFEAEVALQIADSQATCFAQALDIAPGSGRIDRRE